MVIIVVVGGATVGFVIGEVFVVIIAVALSSMLMSLCSLIRVGLGVTVVLIWRLLVIVIGSRTIASASFEAKGVHRGLD